MQQQCFLCIKEKESVHFDLLGHFPNAHSGQKRVRPEPEAGDSVQAFLEPVPLSPQGLRCQAAGIGSQSYNGASAPDVGGGIST